MGIAERWLRFKPLPPDIRERPGLLKPVFRRDGVRLADLFGSLAAGREPDDVDLAVLPRNGDLSPLRQAIMKDLDTERVDLVNLKAASPVLKFEVVSSGRLICKTDDMTENEFETAVLREYHDTAHLRARQAEMLRERTSLWLSKKK